MFKPSLSTIISKDIEVAVVSPSDPVYLATKKMREHRVNSVIIVVRGKPQGILTLKDVLMRVVAHNLSPELTLVEKVMTANPECATLDTTILDALHTMHDGKFLHLPVVNSEGCVVACFDVLQIANATFSMAEGGVGATNELAGTMMQKFWDSALALEPPDEEYETRSELSGMMTSDDTESLDELLTAVIERLGPGNDRDNTQLLYEDDEGDKILLLSDSDLVGAVNSAKSSGSKVLKLHLDNSDLSKEALKQLSNHAVGSASGLTSFQVGMLTGAVLLTSIVTVVYLRRSSL